MLIRSIAVVFAVLLRAHTSPAQPPANSGISRASALARAGKISEARALVDSLMAATPSRDSDVPEILLLRASIAVNRAGADSDLERIVFDHPASPRRADALLSLAQGSLAAGDPDNALEQLRRMSDDYTAPAIQAQASYWGARVLMEKGEMIAACETNDRAVSLMASVTPALRNQITAFATKTCGRSVMSESNPPPVPDTSARIPTPSDTPRGVVRPPGTVRPVPAPPPPANASPLAGKRSYAVQVAAFDTQRAAEKLATRLRKSGLAAHVDGSTKPFRVRIGKYATYREAAEALRDLKSRRLSGFVAELQQ